MRTTMITRRNFLKAAGAAGAAGLLAACGGSGASSAVSTTPASVPSAPHRGRRLPQHQLVGRRVPPRGL